MSFNIRLGVANDGKNRWDLRKDLVVMIKQFQPDLLGLRKCFLLGRILEKEFTRIFILWKKSFSGSQRREACSVMIKRDRFKILRKSTFWLSENQNEPGSKSWDSSLPRIVNLVRLQDQLVVRKELVFFNTHFDHRGK